eukprot:737452-Pelagomonas_calceolata.AAC.4
MLEVQCSKLQQQEQHFVLKLIFKLLGSKCKVTVQQAKHPCLTTSYCTDIENYSLYKQHVELMNASKQL